MKGSNGVFWGPMMCRLDMARIRISRAALRPIGLRWLRIPGRAAAEGIAASAIGTIAGVGTVLGGRPILAAARLAPLRVSRPVLVLVVAVGLVSLGAMTALAIILRDRRGRRACKKHEEKELTHRHYLGTDCHGDPCAFADERMVNRFASES